MVCKEKKTKWLPTMKKEDRDKIIKLFMEEYGAKYPGKIRIGLEDNLKHGVGSYWNLMECFQIYSYLGIFQDCDNFYYGYYKKLKEAFDINCNILDVACGYVPAFGMIVAGKQLELPNSKGKITVCDPALVLDSVKESNLTLSRDKFSSDVDISKFDIVTGIMPCATTRDIIKAACEQNKDFFIGLCGCMPEGYIPESDDEIYMYKNIDYAKKMCQEYGRGDLVETKLDDDFFVSLPVIYSKKR